MIEELKFDFIFTCYKIRHFAFLCDCSTDVIIFNERINAFNERYDKEMIWVYYASVLIEFWFLRGNWFWQRKSIVKNRTICCVGTVKLCSNFGSFEQNKPEQKHPTSTFTNRVKFHLTGCGNLIKIVLQWHSTGASPKSSTITSTADLLSPNGVAAAARDLSMTVPMQRGSMAVLPSRSRFMINDILENGGRSPSPDNPRDLSASAANNNNNHLHHLHHNLGLNHHHLSQHNHLHRHDEDSDSSGPIDDDNSVCSNGECCFFFSLIITIRIYQKCEKQLVTPNSNVQKLHTLRKIARNETKCQNKRINLFSCKEFPLLQIFMHLIVHIRKCIQTFTLCFIVGATNRPTLFPHRSLYGFFLTVVFSSFSFSSSRMRTFE